MDSNKLLDQFGWSSETIYDHDAFVPAQMIYDFTECAAKLSGDPHFAVHAIEATDLKKWPLFVDAIESSHSVAGCFHYIISKVRAETTAIIYSMHSDGKVARIEAQRTFDPIRYPRQIDGMATVIFANLLELLVGEKYLPENVIVSCGDTSAIPLNQFPKGCLLAGKKAFSITFPSQWLDIGICPFEPEGHNHATDFMFKEISTLSVNIVKGEIKNQLSDRNLKIEKIASTYGMKPHVMRRVLAEKRTSFREIYNTARYEKSRDLLVNTNKQVSEIASDIGYAEVANFTRAFKGWTGQTPVQYRRNHS
ncbi:MAG: helix-turn-helix transcriptional regulator [Pseudomonadota bacterium]